MLLLRARVSLFPVLSLLPSWQRRLTRTQLSPRSRQLTQARLNFRNLWTAQALLSLRGRQLPWRLALVLFPRCV